MDNETWKSISNIITQIEKDKPKFELNQEESLSDQVDKYMKLLDKEDIC